MVGDRGSGQSLTEPKAAEVPLVVALNKIDALADPLASAEEVEQQIERPFEHRQRNLIAGCCGWFERNGHPGDCGRSARLRYIWGH